MEETPKPTYQRDRPTLRDAGALELPQVEREGRRAAGVGIARYEVENRRIDHATVGSQIRQQPLLDLRGAAAASQSGGDDIVLRHAAERSQPLPLV